MAKEQASARDPINVDAIQLTKELVAFDTMPETGDEMACQAFLADLLECAGFRVTLDAFEPGRANLYAHVADVPEDSCLCFAGHIDTVALHQGQWESDPLRAVERNGRIHGRGTCDMKGGVAAMLCAAIQARPLLRPGHDLRIHVYGGEEVGCLGSTHMARWKPEELSGVGAVLVAEPTSVLPCVGHKGALWLKVTTNGRAAHGSMPQFGDNALSKALAAAARLESYDIGREEHPVMGGATLTLTTLHSGSSHNSVPDTACFTLDIRTVPGQEPEDIISEIRDLAGEGCELEVLQCIHPLWTDPETPWVRRMAGITGGVLDRLVPEASVVQFFTDGAALRLARPEIPMVILGPGEPSMAHQTNEWCEALQIRQAEAVYREAILQWYGL